MGLGWTTGCLLLFFGGSKAFYPPVSGACGPRRLTNARKDHRSSPSFRRVTSQCCASRMKRISVLPSLESSLVCPAVRSEGSGVLRATVEDVSQTARPRDEDDLKMTPGEEEAVEWPYDWRKQLRWPGPRAYHGWYGVGYECDFPKGEKPFGVTIFDEPMVLFHDGDGILHCVSDFCPHRASKLSEGMVTDGNIECLYHGWQFDGKTGSCVHVPQLPEGAKPPRAANLRVYPLAIREGIVYVWMGDDPWGEGAKDILPVPCTEDDLDKNEPDFRVKFVIDLPYDWSYLAENLLDPAHAPFSHHDTDGGSDRSKACPITFEVMKEGSKAPSSAGFSAKVLNPALAIKGKSRPASYRFQAPGVIYLRSQAEAADAGDKPGDKPRKPEMSFCAQLHTVPLGKGRCRLLLNTYGLHIPPLFKFLIRAKPSVLRYMNACEVLEQDMALICAQEDHVARTGQSLSESFLPIKSSDGMVMELRKWLDRVGHGMPHFTGWKKSKLPTEQLSEYENLQLPKHRSKQSRFYNHVILSECSRTALKNVIRVKRASLAAAALLATMTLFISCTVGASPPVAAGAAGAAGATAAGALSQRGWAGIVAAVGGAVSLALSAAAQKFEGHFYKNFERHPVLG